MVIYFVVCGDVCLTVLLLCSDLDAVSVLCAGYK